MLISEMEDRDAGLRCEIRNPKICIEAVFESGFPQIRRKCSSFGFRVSDFEFLSGAARYLRNHRPSRLATLPRHSTRVQPKSRTCVRLSVVTRFRRLHQGAQKGNAANYFGRCSNRITSKTSILTLNEQRNHFVQFYRGVWTRNRSIYFAALASFFFQITAR